MSNDPLADVAERLATLEREPVAAHPDVLEAVHRTVVAELDALAGNHEVGASAER